MADKKSNFWDGDKQTKIPDEKNQKSPAKTNPPRNSFRFELWWFLGGLAIIVLVVVALLLNSNYNHNGDNANNIAGSIDIDNGDSKINWNRYPTYNIELSETYTISTSGTYYLTGSINDGGIIIKTDSEAVVRLVLTDVTIKNSNGPAISCYSGDDLLIELHGKNYLEDGYDYSADLDEDVTGAIYSKSDLSFTGDGTLNIQANHADAIVGKDDLVIRSGVYNIVASDDGIRGKDSVYIVGGDFAITAVADAIKSTNETDTTKGFILIEGGNFKINAGAKGIKAINSILVYNGSYEINSTDDAIHSNNYIGIIDGKFKISSGDDGIHADARLIVDNGSIEIMKAYEGIEAQKISINGGKISIFSNDDGINAGGGADGSANNRVGAGAFDVDENCELAINGGDIYVNAAGDGIDSNGGLFFNGGKVIVDGPTNNGNGALDSGSGISINGGTVITVGSSGMAETLGSSSSVYNISVYFSSTQAANTKIEIKDSADNTIISHTSAKAFTHMAVGSDEFKYDETYTIYLNDEKYESFKIADITTVIGNSANNFQNMGGRAQGGQTK